MMDCMPNDRFNLMELLDTPMEALDNLMEDVPKTTTSTLLDTREPSRSGRIVWAPDRFMFL